MRSGYSDDIEQRDLAMWRGRVASAMRGKRGQRLLRECLSALNAMPEKRLVPDVLVDGKDVCLLGAVAVRRELPDVEMIDPEDHDKLSEMFDVPQCLIQEIEHINDDGIYGSSGETPEVRYERVHKWLVENIKADAPTTNG